MPTLVAPTATLAVHPQQSNGQHSVVQRQSNSVRATAVLQQQQQPIHAHTVSDSGVNIDSLHDDLMAIDNGNAVGGAKQQQQSRAAAAAAAASKATAAAAARDYEDANDGGDIDEFDEDDGNGNAMPTQELLDETSDDQQQMATLISGGGGQAMASMVAAASSSSTASSGVLPANIEKIDEYDIDDAQCVTEYLDEIFGYLRFKEKDSNEVPDANYMQRQRDLAPKMRAILVDWMVDVHIKFKLLSETMFLAVNIIDRFLTRVEVKRDKLQLVGVTAMLVASKYEEIYSPEVRDFVYISDRAFSKEEILALEIKILHTLKFSLTPATPLHFLRRFSKAARSDATTHTLSKYLIELALPEYSMLRFTASTIAAAAVYIARAMHNITPIWNATLEHYTQFDVPKLRECAIELNKALLHVYKHRQRLCVFFKTHKHKLNI